MNTECIRKSKRNKKRKKTTKIKKNGGIDRLNKQLKKSQNTINKEEQMWISRRMPKQCQKDVKSRSRKCQKDVANMSRKVIKMSKNYEKYVKKILKVGQGNVKRMLKIYQRRPDRY